MEPNIVTVALLQQERNLLATKVPDFDHFNYQEILDWAAEHAEAKVEWCNAFYSLKDGVETKYINDKHALWSFYWKFGVIGLDSFKKEQEEEAKMAAALFLYMYLKGVSASTADKASTAYTLRYFDAITRM